MNPSPIPSSGTTPQQQQAVDQNVRLIQLAMESCPAKFVMSGVIGAGLGAAFGLFMTSFEFAGPQTDPEVLAKQTTRQQFKAVAKEMGQKSMSMGKNFAVVGAIFSGTECCIESYRARNDVYNGAAAGCFTGGVLAARAGPQAAMWGCAGFAAFSTAIEWYMRRE